MARKHLAYNIVVALGIFIAFPHTVAGCEIRLTLNWTTPGDDGWIGRAAQYDIRVSRAPINEANFYRAAKVAGFLVPSFAGSKETMVVTGLTPGVDYYFAVKTRDEVGNWSGISNVVLWSDKILTTEPALTSLDFSTPSPNPARRQTRFRMTLPTSDLVRIEAFDMGGRRVRTLANGDEPAGTHDMIWNLADDSGRRLAAGVYIVSAQIGKTLFTRRVSVVR